MSLTLTAMSNSAGTGGQQEWSGPGQTPGPSRGPYISVITNRTTNLLIRGAMLFSVGVFLSLVLNLLQVQRNVTLFPPDVISSIFSSAWWVPPCCGTASGM
ncbi:insulin-induced gene 2 protein-like [Notothenia coriiceps]|uniref:Insulin-induced gene 2 protein n=1 Tax=Notothenia coriiceps TaxID=8208 RepID=A0A6I9NYU0_9TELE|nr:PREDICTED: insulin-induced gene 2 protein-like [Notothenia coriiceps]